MTFYEAALRVLETAGRPLTFQEITEKSIQQSLLSHIGKTPELTMLSRLLAMARRKTDRKIVVTAKDTFALTDWGFPEPPDALSETAKSEIREEDNLPPLRPAERHPEPRAENVRIAGRGAERKRRHEHEDEERGRRKKRFPPMPEVVFEILSERGGTLSPTSLLDAAKERELAPADVTEQALLTALLEDNQRRIDAGRRPQFVLQKDTGEVGLERAGAPSEAPPVELQAAFAAALGIPMEGGRPVLPQKTAPALPTETLQEVAAAHAALKTAARDARRAVSRALRKKLLDVDLGTFERSMVKVLHALGFRELKVAKRSKDGPLMTARKRDGSLELRFAIRLLKGNATVDRRAVQELRRDLGHYGAQVGLIATAGELRGEARSEATGSGSLIFLWCGEGLSDKYLEAEVGVSVTHLESYEVDERFFDAARADAEEAARRREERHREKTGRRDERPPKEPSAPPPPAEAAAPSEEQPAAIAEAAPPPGEPAQAFASAVEASEGEGKEALAEGEEEDDEEGDEDLDEAEAFVSNGRPEGAPGSAPGGAPGQPGQPAERRRRRRRRRGRRGRGRTPEGAPGAPGAPGAQPGQPGQQAAPQGGGTEASTPAPAPAPAAPSTPPPSSGSGEGNAG